MNQELVDALALKHKLTKSRTRRLLEDFRDGVIRLTWDLGRCQLTGFGIFEVRTRKARRIRNPDTDLPMLLPSRLAVTFRASSNWRSRPTQQPRSTQSNSQHPR
jgi:DNA-binding protein HU-beta